MSSKSQNISKFYPWCVIALCALFLFYKYVLQVSPNVLALYLQKTFHLTGVGLGNLAAAFFYAYMITQLFVGIILDNYSVRWICTLAILASAIGGLGFAYSTTYLEAFFSRALMGFGAAFATVCYLKNAAVWFKPERYALISGLLATAAMIGAFCGQSPFAVLKEAFGANQTLIIIGLFGIVIALLFLLFVRDAPDLSNASNSSNYSNSVSFKQLFKIIKNPQNILLMLYSGLTFSPVAVFGGLWGDPFFHTAYHMSDTQGAFFVSMAFLGLAVGGPTLGGVSDIFKNRKVTMFAGNIFSLFCVVLLIYIPHLPSWALIMLLFGFGWGVGAFMLGFTVGKEINPIILAATVIALINTGDALMGAFSEPLIGKILDLQLHLAHHSSLAFLTTHDFHMAFILLPVYLIIATVLLIFIKDSGGRQIEPK